MKDINRIYDECMEILEDCGIPVTAPRPVLKVNKRATQRWGQSIIRHATGYREISIASVMLEDKADEYPVHNTMLHEMLHQECPREHHGGKWARLAAKVTKETKFNITRCSNYDEYGVKFPEEKKYTCTCERCGATFGRSRLERGWLQYAREGLLTHGQNDFCGGRISIVQNW